MSWPAVLKARAKALPTLPHPITAILTMAALRSSYRLVSHAGLHRVEHVGRLPDLGRLIDVADDVGTRIVVRAAGPLTAGIDADDLPSAWTGSSTSAHTETGYDIVRSGPNRQRAYHPGCAGTISTILFTPLPFDLSHQPSLTSICRVG
jgi:hypothetical protein